MNTNPFRTTFASRLPILLAGYPLVWMASVYLFVLRARLHLGFWPEPSRPDPKDLGFTVHHAVNWFGLAMVPGAVLAAVVLAVVGSRLGWRTKVWPSLSLATVSLVAVVATGRLDPGRFFEWFVD